MFKNKLNALWLVGILAVPATIYGLGTLNGSASQSQFSQVAAGDSTSLSSMRNTDSGRNMQTAGFGTSSSRPVLSIPGSNNTNRLNTNSNNNSFSNLNNQNNGLGNNLGNSLNNNFGNNRNNNQNNSFAANNNQNNSFAANNNQNNSFAANSNQNMQVLNGRNNRQDGNPLQGFNGNSRNNDGLVAIYAPTPERRQPARTQQLDRMDDHHDTHAHDDHGHDHSDTHHDDHHAMDTHHDTHADHHADEHHNVLEIKAVGDIDSIRPSFNSFVVQQPLTATTANSVVTPSGARAVNNLGLDPHVRATGNNHVTSNAIYGSTHMGSDNEYDAYGYDLEGYDFDGYDYDGYDREGYNWDGYDREGYDREGYDFDGYDREGYDRTGYYGW